MVLLYNIKLEKVNGKSKKKIFKLAIIGLAIFSVLFLISYAIGGKKYFNKNVVVGASNTPRGDTQEQNAKNTNYEKINNNNESKVPPNNLDKQLDNSTEESKKEAFLTFDDGPTKGITPEILDVLKQYDVRATFFVIGKMVNANKEILIREKNEGHAIGNHSYSHDYKYLYAEPKNFVDDINKADMEIKNVLLEYNLKLIRFPGGSFGSKREPYRKAITEAGYHYIDWNALNGDAEQQGTIPADKLLEKVKQTARGQKHLVILMHDAPGKHTTAEALPKIIEYLKAEGYTFKTLE